MTHGARVQPAASPATGTTTLPTTGTTTLPTTGTAASPATGAAHRVALAGTTWSVWRDVALRSAGFPADKILAICDEPLARSADLAGADPSGLLAYDSEYVDSGSRLSRAIAGVVADPAFHEALSWQNPALAQILYDAGPRPVRRSKDRKRELVIASYLQRYSLKNDTIGFFGPVAWASAGPAQDHAGPAQDHEGRNHEGRNQEGRNQEGLTVAPGEQLIARRTTYFEVWAIDKVAAEIARQGRALGWLRPRRPLSTLLAGNVLHRPYRRPVTLTRAELDVLLACDGRATIAEVLDQAGQPDAHALTRLAELGAVRLDLEGPVHAWPERLLLAQLDQIADPAARAAARAPLARLIWARSEVAAAGDPVELRRALADLAATFEQVTGSPATRRAGEMYAGRTLVYQDTVRDVRVELGTAVTTALAGPLGLVLDSARWLVNDITARYRALFTELVDQEMARNGGRPVPLSRLLTVASPYLSFRSGRGLSELTAASVAELRQRWHQVLGSPQSQNLHQVSAAAIAAKVAECFPGRPVAWSGARQHSPDIMIAAASPADVDRGDFLLVLGELHLAHNTLESRALVEQHPEPARLIAGELADHGARRIISMPAKDYPNVTSRSSPPSALLGPGQLYWSAGLIESLDPDESDESATVLPAAALTVTRRGNRTSNRTSNGTSNRTSNGNEPDGDNNDLVVQVAPSATELDFFEVIGDLMGGLAVNAFQPVTPAAHQPRICIDRLVLSREQWTLQVADCRWAFSDNEQERYYLARRWRQEHGLPEQLFYRVPVELKPIAADFRSIVLVNLFAKHIRQTEAAGQVQFTVTEMLPGLDQLWLADRAGQRYSSELRFVAFDAMSPDQPAR